MPWCSPLILHLSFNEGHGRTIHDSSPSALHVELDPSSPLSNDGATLAGEPGWVTGQGAVCGAALVSPFAIILRWGQSSARMLWGYVHFLRDCVSPACLNIQEMMTDGRGDCFTLERVPFGQAVTISVWALLHSDNQGGPGGGGQIINCHSDGGNDGSHTEALVIETTTRYVILTSSPPHPYTPHIIITSPHYHLTS